MRPLCPIMYVQWDRDWTPESTPQSPACFSAHTQERADSGGRGVCGCSPPPLGIGSRGDALACGNSREGWSGYLPSQERSNILFSPSPWVGKARWLALAQLGLHGPVGEAQ